MVIHEGPRDEELPRGDLRMSLNTLNTRIVVETVIADLGAFVDVLRAVATKVEQLHAQELLAKKGGR